MEEQAEQDAQTPTPREVPPLHPRIDGFAESVVTIETGAGVERVVVKVAATAEERRRGLMEVTELPDGVGMLFLFDEQRTGGFWMRDTLVPLDIAFIRGDGSIGTIRRMEPCTTEDPSACPVTTPPHAYRTALEVPAGWFEAHDVAEGDRVEWREPRPELT